LEQRAKKFCKDYVDAWNRQDGSRKPIEEAEEEFIESLPELQQAAYKAMMDIEFDRIVKPVVDKAIEYANRISDAESKGDIYTLESLCTESFGYSCQLPRYQKTAYMNAFDEARAKKGYMNGGYVQGVKQSPYDN
jgi:hypothetical protein